MPLNLSIQTHTSSGRVDLSIKTHTSSGRVGMRVNKLTTSSNNIFIVRRLLSAVPGRTKFWSQKPWIIEVQLQ